MRIDLPVRRHSRLSLTPLIDVIFLLLLFFMLSSTFSRYSEISFSGGGSATSPASQPDVILSVGEGELKLNGVILPLSSIGDGLAELKQAGARHLLVMVGANAASQDFVAVMAEVRRAEMPATIARQQR
ncbi:MAG: biopolymer transporter ExbD [Hoeflea sp.]|uniref:ExbD/TolR family protein n=1 Tax=Hoeflea sp. TaxID=1940281 RepID=UPI001D6B7297|nr:biopolymer transporter ExbD [Hoeflea sp.]MBU4531901.1 biopolymer transporter ExbD [Alphaproteobacteria bacterium]MBU4546323.1 biopolymer transporter ExbD [Alphaproteobacteria bacterium]MBU4549452.1 biopolymer transporter ExbD [Alphaproteobacteria bacterium]MBV1722627.1 biopolymer transporter ExbD [Hoeflea sp.]MBV1782565.1 biopolymer transporter ExbD [Hoeflea sp.]